ncbi:MAG: zinc ribbon domain-containing protein [Bacillota bacterium]|nr:zinc ribbon domain-containing protein [Bacillota bacterium]
MSIVLGIALIALAITVALSGSPVTRSSEGRISLALAVGLGAVMLLTTLLQVGKRPAGASKPGVGGGMATSTASRRCPRCGSDLLDEYVACPYCGLSLKVECPACGKELKSEFLLCPFCGHNLKEPGTSREPFPVPAPKTHEQEPRPRGRKYRAGITALALVLVIGGGFAIVPEFIHRTVSPTENAALWSKAHAALFQFIGEGMKTFGQDEARPATPQELSSLSKHLDDFDRAVKKIARITPPPEQAIMHQALLPIYQEMRGHMAGIRDSLLSGDTLRAELEWNRLALLLDQVARVTEILTPGQSTAK